MHTERGSRVLFGACGRSLAWAGVFSLALNLLMLVVPLYMMSVYDRVLTGRSVETLLMLTLLALGVVAIVGVLESVRQIILARTAVRLETSLGGQVLEASLKGGPANSSEIQGLRDLGETGLHAPLQAVEVGYGPAVTEALNQRLHVQRWG